MAPWETSRQAGGDALSCVTIDMNMKKAALRSTDSWED